MKLESHIAFGLFFGISLYFLFNFNFIYVLITAASAFLPDIDWSMQFKWKMGGVHRTFAHNIWFMLIVSGLISWLFLDILLFIAVLLGILSHLISDSLTITGVSWLYPYGKERKMYLRGPLKMGQEWENKIERYFQTIFLTGAGFLFLIKSMTIELFSAEGLITLAIVAFVGYILMNQFDKLIKSVIRSIGI